MVSDADPRGSSNPGVAPQRRPVAPPRQQHTGTTGVRTEVTHQNHPAPQACRCVDAIPGW